MKKNSKEIYMHKALDQAKLALKKNEVPVGAIITDENGLIIARGHNQIEGKRCHTAHAEVMAIQKACKKRNNWRLSGCTMYVTLEPCRMCLGLIQLSRLERIVFGAKSTLFGTNILGQSACQDTQEQCPPFAKNLKVEGGIKEKDCIALLRLFFSDKRKKRKDGREIESGVYTKNKTVAHQKKK